MTDPVKIKFASSEPLAIAPTALWQDYAPQAPQPGEQFQRTPDGQIAIVTVRGPLMHHEDCWFDNYDRICSAVAQALASDCRAVVLSIDSPGGVVSGALDAARNLRGMAQAAGKQLAAFVDEQATSAAYALACAADHICSPATGVVGSIGVVEITTDVSAALAAQGIAKTVITSGDRKADGHPEIPLSDGAAQAIQSRVDRMAEEFFSLVSDMRPGLSSDKLRGYQAAVYIGRDAQAAGLVDSVATESQFFESIAKGSTEMADNKKGEADAKAAEAKDDKKMPFADLKAALKAAAEGDDADAKVARKMLKALAEDDADDAQAEDAPDCDSGPPSSAPASAKGKAKAEDKKPMCDDDADDADAKATAGLAAQVQALSAKLSAREAADAAAKAEAFYAAHPGLAPELVAELRKLPLEKAEKIVASMPAKAPAPAQARGTRGDGQGGQAPGELSYASAAAEDMDRIMGVQKLERAVVHQGTLTQFGAMVPAKKGS